MKAMLNVIWSRIGIHKLATQMFRRFVLLCFVAFFAWHSAAIAEVNLDLRKATIQPIPIAVVPFLPIGNDNGIGANIASVVSADLERSGLFVPTGSSSPQTADALVKNGPNFADWKAAGVQALVVGSVTILQDGKLQVDFHLYDVFGMSEQRSGLRYTSLPGGWRRMAHKIADEIYSRITGESGYFDTRIVYIAESGPGNRRRKQLAIMDQDGANSHIIGDPKVLALTPRYSPVSRPGTDSVDITYMAYFNNKPRVYLFNPESGQQEVVGDFPGMTSAPRFSPDGNSVIMGLSQNGMTEIYTYNLRTRQKQQLTRFGAISTSPCYSPDGSKIAFESDRGGSQQIYVMSSDGSSPTRISFGNGRYAEPVWSPRGDYIAFVKQAGGQFHIGIMRPDGSGERILDSSYFEEGPTWAPNGRVLMFYRSGPSTSGTSTARMMTVDITGRNLRQVVTSTPASDPAWSPLLPSFRGP